MIGAIRRAAHVARSLFKKRELKQVDVLGSVEPTWKGNHKACPRWHWTGVCHADQAWTMNGEARLVPVVVDRPTSGQFKSDCVHSNGRVEPAWVAKGFRLASETGGTRPTRGVVNARRASETKDLERGLIYSGQRDGVAAGLAAFVARFDKANARRWWA